MTYARKQMGQAGEILAANYLKQQGLEILARNWKWKHGEIDIVAREGDTLVFVEVKTFGDDYWSGGPSMNVTAFKRRKVIQGAQTWIAMRKQQNMYVRFDVVAVFKQDAVVEHLPGAFVESS